MAGNITVLKNFECKEILGTSRESVEVARDVVNSLTLSHCTFSCIHEYQGRRFVYGYVYSNKMYGTVNIQSFEGWGVTYDIVNGVYTQR